MDSTGKLLSWFIVSFFACAVLFAFGYYNHYFDGDSRWLAIGAAAVGWLVISGAVWIVNSDPELDKIEKVLLDEPENR